MMKARGYTAMAASLLWSGLAMGQAVSLPPPPTLPAGAISSMTASSAPQSLGAGVKSTNVAAAAYVVGWNFRVCYRSLWHSPDNATSIVWAYNTDGSKFYFTTTSYAGQPQAFTPGQNQLVAACQNGPKGYYVFITNATTLAYSAIMIAY